MSDDVKRYDPAIGHDGQFMGMWPVSNGLYVRDPDYTALRARLETVTEERNVQNDLRQIAEDAADELRARLEAVEKELAEMTAAKDIHQTRRAEYFARAERAEAALALRNGECEAKKIIIAQLEAALATARRDAEPYIIMIGPYRGVCVGGRWNNWLFHKHADGHWVSQQKLNPEPLSSALANEAAT